MQIAQDSFACEILQQLQVTQLKTLTYTNNGTKWQNLPSKTFYLFYSKTKGFKAMVCYEVRYKLWCSATFDTKNRAL